MIDNLHCCCHLKLQLCRAVKQMCSGFNLVDEVQTVLDSLKKQARSLQSVAARATAQETIDSISLFLSDLARDYDPSTRPGVASPSACLTTSEHEFAVCHLSTLLGRCRGAMLLLAIGSL